MECTKNGDQFHEFIFVIHFHSMAIETDKSKSSDIHDKRSSCILGRLLNAFPLVISLNIDALWPQPSDQVRNALFA